MYPAVPWAARLHIYPPQEGLADTAALEPGPLKPRPTGRRSLAWAAFLVPPWRQPSGRSARLRSVALASLVADSREGNVGPDRPGGAGPSAATAPWTCGLPQSPSARIRPGP